VAAGHDFASANRYDNESVGQVMADSAEMSAIEPDSGSCQKKGEIAGDELSAHGSYLLLVLIP
jgi:hypothetical protein